MERLEKNARSTAAINFLKQMPREHLGELFQLLDQSKSQFFQDLFVLSSLDFKRGGFFVEFGATNGVDLSNSWLLEKRYDWDGIVAEPARHWHANLKKNRGCRISTACVWKESGQKLVFNETKNTDLSTLDAFTKTDMHATSRHSSKKYEVETVSLNDLLRENNAPKHIDYISIDTEGSELDIISHFNFSDYTISVMTVEHNFSENREKINEILTSVGFIRVLESISLFDDWYINPLYVTNIL